MILIGPKLNQTSCSRSMNQATYTVGTNVFDKFLSPTVGRQRLQSRVKELMSSANVYLL